MKYVFLIYECAAEENFYYLIPEELLTEEGYSILAEAHDKSLGHELDRATQNAVEAIWLAVGFCSTDLNEIRTCLIYAEDWSDENIKYWLGRFVPYRWKSELPLIGEVTRIYRVRDVS